MGPNSPILRYYEKVIKGHASKVKSKYFIFKDSLIH